MSELEQVITWLRTYEGHDILKDWHVDYTDQVPSCGAVFPQGLQEIERRTYITGAVCVTNQSNFGLYFTFAKSAGDDEGAKINADWVNDFQHWVQEQSTHGLAPNFGNAEESVIARAQNGVLYEAEAEGTATYMVVLSLRYTKTYESEVKTDIVEVKLWDAQSSGAFPAVREECYIEVSSYGGDTTGYQIPFNVHYTGVKTKGTFNPTTKAFTAEA